MRVGTEVADAPHRAVDEIDLAALRRIVVERRRWIIVPTLATLLLSSVAVNVVKPRYTAEAKIVLENQQSFLPGSEKTETGITQQLDAEAVGSQVVILTSRDLARKVMKTVGLAGNPEFDPLADGMGAVERLLVLTGLKRDPTRLSPEDRMLESYFDRLTVLSPMKTRVLTVEFSSRDPDLSAKVANAIADLYLEFQSDAKRTNARAAAESLGQRVSDLKTRVAAADAKAEVFRSQTGLLVGTNNTSINAQQLSDVNTELARARTAQADAQAKANLLREMIRGGRIAEIPDVANNELVRRISEQRVTAKAQLALESRTLLPGHPRIKELAAQVADYDNEIRAAGEKTARSLDADSRVASARVDNLAKALDAQKKLIGASGSDEVQMRELDRSARALKDELEATNTKYQEAVAREGSKATPSDARIFSRALAPQVPSFPKKLPIIAISTLAALILSIGAAAAREFMRVPKLAVRRPAEDVVEEAAPMAQGDVTPIRSETRSPISSVAKSQAKNPFGLDDVVADVETLAPSGGLVLFMPLAGDNGLALALARDLVGRGRVVLVAGDSGTVTPMPAQAGLAELLDGSVSFADAIHRDRNSRLHIIPAGLSGRTNGDIGAILDALKGTYDLVILGAPYAMDDAEAQAVMARTDVAVIGPGEDGAAQDLVRAAETAGVPHVLRVAETVEEAAAA